MGNSSRFTALLVAASAATAQRAGLQKRATDDAPDGYTPTVVDCPSDRPTIRDGSELSSQEREWTLQRRNETIPHIRDLLNRIAIPDFDSEAYLSDVETDPEALPNIGLAFSGGGYRAMLCGAGQLAALDSRSTGSDTAGNIGGLFQSSTYVSALSGGAWLVGSLYTNNITTVEASMNSGNVWELQNSILEGPEQYAFLDYFDNIFDSVGDKDDEGYERSITDYWGRMLSHQLINASYGGPGYTFSSIADNEEFSDGLYPLPFLVALGRKPDEDILSINSTVYEFTPWELGSSDNTIEGYVPLRWVGSNFTNGEIDEDGECVRGFDNSGFVMGTSSSLFNQFVLYLNDPDSGYIPEAVPDFVIEGLTSVLDFFGDANNDIADWTPNPFKDWNSETNYLADEDRLTLVDGGEDLQNVPYHPLIRNEREVDVIFSFDNSADTEMSWPDGASPIATYERSLEDIAEGTSFPAVPDKATFVNNGLNARPTFFGCDAENTTDPSPLIVYIPNYPYLYYSNTSTFQLSYNTSERDAMVENGWAVATQLNGTRDPDWPICVGCAVLKRSFDRTNTTYPDRCEQCFDSYCWDGSTNTTDGGTYDPTIFDEPIDVEDASPRTVAGGAMSLVVAGVVAAVLSL